VVHFDEAVIDRPVALVDKDLKNTEALFERVKQLTVQMRLERRRPEG
jgi:hypothetical protein